MVELEDFFDFNSKEPINRLAYTEEDLQYKIKVIKKMQELGMTVTIDKIGNICGSIQMGNKPEKTMVIGSHTDSVYNGGQYDGPVGVITGLQTVEELLKSKKINGTVKVAIYSCEESSRFGNACLGSKYLNGNITEEDFDKIKDQKELENGKTVTLRDAIEYEKSYLKENVEGIQEVEKIFSDDEIDYSLESHIEQYQILNKRYKKSGKEQIGIINSIGSAVRVKYDVQGKSGHTGSTPMKKRKNAVDATAFIGKKVRKLGKQYEEEGLGRASQVEINTIGHNGSFNQIPDSAQGLIDFRLLGENTPDKVLKDFNKITQKVERKTKTQIIPTIVSKGTPVKTSQELNSIIATTCNQKKIPYIEMPSYAGQDTGYVPAKEKTMIFIPSTGGSHNPEEKTKRKFIEAATKVLVGTAQTLLLEKWKDSCKYDTKKGKTSGKKKTTGEIVHTNNSQNKGMDK